MMLQLTMIPQKTSQTDGDCVVSKSAKKRHAKALQDLGRKITQLQPDQRQQLHLPEDIHDAVNNYLRFTSNEAKRRQLHFLGKLLRKIDVATIGTDIERIEGTSQAARAEQHALERWRERLLTDAAALTEYLDTFPAVDRQQLRNLVKRSKTAKTEQQRTKASRELFRFLRESLIAQTGDQS